MKAGRVERSSATRIGKITARFTRYSLTIGHAAATQLFKFVDRGLIQQELQAEIILVECDFVESIDHTLDLTGVCSGGKLGSAYER